MKLRAPRDDDFDAMLELMNAHQLAAYGEEDVTADELRTWLTAPTVDPARDVRVLEDDGRLIGYVDADKTNEDPPRWWSDLKVAPDADVGVVLPELFAWLDGRAESGRLRIWTSVNDRRLLDAFAEVHRAHPATQLVIAGSGPLLGALELQAEALRISDAVIFTGHQSNPHAIMAASDCFVLSSNYEGQPMVLLEALMVGLPIVTVEFGAVADAVPEGSALIVSQDVRGLVEGMNAFLDGQVTARPFDPEAYNREAITEFSRAIGATPSTAIRTSS